MPTILFDAVGTLIIPEPPVARVYRELAARAGSLLSEEEIRDRFRRVLSAEGEPGSLERPVTSETAEHRRWRQIVAEVLADLPNAGDAVFPDLWRHFAQPTSWRLLDGAAEVWRELEARGYRLGVASNFDARLRSVLAGLPPLDRCDDLFISSELGHPKPDPRFFRAVEQRLGVRGDEILLVGDDWTNDILGGQSAGWQTVWLSTKEPPPHIRTIHHLKELTIHL